MFEYLKQMPNYPKHINVLGKILPEDEKNILVIGTRNMTRYGKNVIKSIIPDLVKSGYAISSTITEGCDFYSLEVACSNNGRCLVYLSEGINLLKSFSNFTFIEKLINANLGAVISPFKRGSKISKETLIYRNAIMTFLSKGLLIVEAGERSRTASCVHFALDYGKSIFCVPGDIFRYKSAGTNSLIKEGACLVRNADDVIEELN